MPKHALVIVDPQKHHARHQGRVPSQLHALHTIADSACPEGQPNCENCGDPAFAASCRAAGHCVHCGTRHGIAPKSVLAAVGIELQPLAAEPAEDEDWHPATRSFVKRVRVDRLEDLKADPQFTAATASLSAAKQQQLEAAVAKLLGARRYRVQGLEEPELG